MAIEFIQAVWEMSAYRAEKLLVQLACADWANDAGEFWPSYDEIAHKARVTKPGAIGIIQQLLDDGDIVLIEKSDGGRGRRNRFRFSDHYLDAVDEVRRKWQASRARNGKPALPNPAQKTVNQPYRKKTEKVNENDEKGKPGPCAYKEGSVMNRQGEEGDPLSPPAEDPLALAIAKVGLGLNRLPENGSADEIHEAAARFQECGITPEMVFAYEDDFYRRKNAAGKRYVLTLNILINDLPLWARAQRFLVETKPPEKLKLVTASKCPTCRGVGNLPIPLSEKLQTGKHNLPCPTCGPGVEQNEKQPQTRSTAGSAGDSVALHA